MVDYHATKPQTRHYENTSIQIYRNCHLQKLKIFKYKNSDIFHISAQNIDCGYSLEPPRWGSSNKYPQFMFLAEITKTMYTPANPSFTIEKWGLRGSKLYRHVFVMGTTFHIHGRTCMKFNSHKRGWKWKNFTPVISVTQNFFMKGTQ